MIPLLIYDVKFSGFLFIKSGLFQMGVCLVGGGVSGEISTMLSEL